MAPLTADPAGYLRLCLALVAVLALPGSTLVTGIGHPSRGLGRLALAVGCSIAVVPLAVLWASTAGLRWSRGGWIAVLAACAAVTAVKGARLWQRRRTAGGWERGVAAIALLIILAMALALRASQAIDLVAAPWVDGYHHTLMAQLFVDAGAVPTSYRPYLAVDGFYYHFGFHALAAVVAVVADVPTRLAVLWLGQALNAAASLTTWQLARRLGIPPAAAVWAAAVPTGLFFFPAYFLSWGRDTQLAGLVALPAALMLLVDAVRPEAADLTLAEAVVESIDRTAAGSGRRVALAGVVAGGLLLVHYRVMVFYDLGALVVLAWLVWQARDSDVRPAVRAAVVRMVSVAVVALFLVGPWLARHLLPGIGHLRRAAADWYVGPSGVADVPWWQLSTHQNAVWLAVGVAGLVAGVVLRRPVAWALTAWLALAIVAVFPTFLGLPRSWMLPPSALVISLFLPVAVAVALAAEAIGDLARAHGGATMAAWIVPFAACGAAWLGARGQTDVVNADTVLLTAPDLEAFTWIRAHTPADARFAIGTTEWQFGTFRGVDGGYWLPLLAGRDATVPAALYTYGVPDDVRRIGALCDVLKEGDKLSVPQLSAVLDKAGADYVYVGPAARPGFGFGADRLRNQPDLMQVYARDGVAVFQRRPAGASR